MLRDLRRDRLRSLDDAGAGPPTGLDGGESCYALRYRSALGRRDDFRGPSDRARTTSMIATSVSAPRPTCPTQAPTHHRSAWVAGAESSEAAPNGTSRRRTPINAVAHARWPS